MSIFTRIKIQYKRAKVIHLLKSGGLPNFQIAMHELCRLSNLSEMSAAELIDDIVYSSLDITDRQALLNLYVGLLGTGNDNIVSTSLISIYESSEEFGKLIPLFLDTPPPMCSVIYVSLTISGQPFDLPVNNPFNLHHVMPQTLLTLLAIIDGVYDGTSLKIWETLLCTTNSHITSNMIACLLYEFGDVVGPLVNIHKTWLSVRTHTDLADHDMSDTDAMFYALFDRFDIMDRYDKAKPHDTPAPTHAIPINTSNTTTH